MIGGAGALFAAVLLFIVSKLGPIPGIAVAMTLLAAAIVGAISLRRWSLKGGPLVAAVLLVMLWLLPKWRGMLEHDRLHRQLASQVCAHQPPAQTKVLSCRSVLLIRKPEIICEYATVVRLQSGLDVPELVRYYDSVTLGPLVEKRRLVVDPDDSSYARFFAIDTHDRADFRC